MSNSLNYIKSHGFTLIELLITMALLSGLATLGVVVGLDFYRSYAFNAERDTLVAMLQKARNQSMNNMQGLAHGVRVESGQYILFNAPYVAGSPTNEIIPAHPAIINSGLTEVIFTQLSGTTSSNSTLHITDGKRSTNISINTEGRVEW